MTRRTLVTLAATAVALAAVTVPAGATTSGSPKQGAHTITIDGKNAFPESIATAGDVYVTDSLRAVVYRIPAAGPAPHRTLRVAYRLPAVSGGFRRRHALGAAASTGARLPFTSASHLVLPLVASRQASAYFSVSRSSR